MKIKSFNIEALSTGRDKVSLAEKIDKAVDSFLDANGGELKSITVKSELQTGGFGNALVVISYEQHKKRGD